jgi:hypothetical protein
MIPNPSRHVDGIPSRPRHIHNPWTRTAGACSRARGATLHYPPADRAKTRPTATNGGPRVIPKSAGRPQRTSFRRVSPRTLLRRAPVR